ALDLVVGEGHPAAQHDHHQDGDAEEDAPAAAGALFLDGEQGQLFQDVASQPLFLSSRTLAGMEEDGVAGGG
ncbi:hypothetical protein, partial [Escherichia coli]|uniref:hypothetical protein n=1 Tax=Escherichia coli TaxID=562 RepID=UPI003CF36A0A